MSTSRRFVANPFADYDGQENLLSSSANDPALKGALREDLARLIIEPTFTSNAHSLLTTWESNFAKDIDGGRDLSVYTGITGAILLYLKLATTSVRGGTVVDAAEYFRYLQKAAALLDLVMGREVKRGRPIPTFICGEVGLLAVAALLEARLRRRPNPPHQQSVEELLKAIAAKASSTVLDLQMKTGDRRGDGNLPDELLYGRAGYLYALLLLRKELPKVSEQVGAQAAQILPDELIRSVVQAILDSGVRTAAAQDPAQERISSPLVYTWHGSPYVGAAHGYAGIAYLLLQAKAYLSEQQLVELVKPMVDWVVSLRFPATCNFPSSVAKEEDKLVHWCHGSPGVIYMLAAASEVFAEDGGGAGGDSYAEIAFKAGEDIWARGLLKKGYGLCHGVAGNAYAFLRLFQLSGGRDHRWLHRAVKFAEWCSVQYGRHTELGVRAAADRPYSLFEGLSGTLYFLLDILRPMEARFPAFQLD